jgi:GNAT superfamily N-acetyltransferase
MSRLPGLGWAEKSSELVLRGSALPAQNDRELPHHRREVRGRETGTLQVGKSGLAVGIVLEVVGVVVLVPVPRSILLENVAVDPVSQGKGYGRLLLAFAEQEARRQSFEVIRLYTNALMIENLALYPRLGYVETHRGEEKGYSRVYIGKRLVDRQCSS